MVYERSSASLKWLVLIILSPLLLYLPGHGGTDEIPVLDFEVVNTFPHDISAFTQGLFYHDDFLYEGTGQRGSSTLRKVDLETGKIIRSINLPDRYFGEGITLYDNKIIQLTWRSNIGIVYDLDTFKKTNQFHYSHEGWGITNDGKYLYLSDGTSILHILDPITFTEIRQIEVWAANGPVQGINELEYIEGSIYANIYPTEFIAVISPETGQVLSWIRMTKKKF